MAVEIFSFAFEVVWVLKMFLFDFITVQNPTGHKKEKLLESSGGGEGERIS